jgi:hypothetical protein
MLLCHELGHFYGGKPFYQVKSEDHYKDFAKMSVEGQADFFTTAYCLREFSSVLGRHLKNSSSRFSEFCKKNHPDDLHYCRVALEGIDKFIDFLRVSGNYLYDHFGIGSRFDQRIDILEKDFKTEYLIYPNEYPSLQCRAQTMVLGVGCKNFSYMTGRCSSMNRPNCWYGGGFFNVKKWLGYIGINL